MRLVLNKDGHPCREAARYLADFFGVLASDRGNILDFSMPIAVEKACETVACHGGYGLVLPIPSPGPSVYEDFFVGAEKIARVMGFEESDDYATWAQKNSSLWGNIFGALMFHFDGYLAFGEVDPAKCGLKTVSDWYAAMAARLQPSDNGYVAPPKYNGG